MSVEDTRITPRFWYCPLCGYMMVTDGPGAAVASQAHSPECPMCGEDTVPCWQCIATRDFSKDWCASCDRKAQCEPGPRLETTP